MKKFVLSIVLFSILSLSACSVFSEEPYVGMQATLDVYVKDSEGNYLTDSEGNYLTEKISGTISSIRETEEYYFIRLEGDFTEYQIPKSSW